MRRFEGIYPAILTPFDNHGRFDPVVFERLIAHLYQQAVSGLYVCGVCGEGLVMSPEEREAVAEVAVHASRSRGSVIVQVGSGNTADSARLAKQAVRIGADGISCLAPYTNLYGKDALIRHFTAVAEASRPLPFLVYYNPSVAPSLNNYGLLERILDIPGVAGAKFSGTDAAELAYLVYERADRQNILTGVDEALLSAQLMGAHGAVGAFANLFPELFVRVYKFTREGKWQDANRAQRELVKLIRIVEQYPFLSALKTALRVKGLHLGQPRGPSVQLTAEQQEELLDRLDAEGPALNH